MSAYVALLRGINVGGNNLIKMDALRACFEALGFADVRTYIASGNVLFESRDAPKKLVPKIEGALAKRFGGYEAKIVLRSREQMLEVVAEAPRGFGTKPEEHRYDVIFLRDGIAAKKALASVKVKEGVDQASAGPGVLYFSRLVARATQSQLNKIVGLPIYQEMTIRNWNTTTKLATLLEASSRNG